ncbi:MULTISPECIES: methyl-accepting chemotaxis protein [Pantoea]|uniref:methyl-accepting chemotaxis protein n=1 Tax=Pantoea TaxID=53335 RepID=UPI000EA0ED9C|nr:MULTISPECIES: methyl-accepting chemotaxis protein [Pantoea]MBZ6386568.1 methyl-accepting chemotaxis protein [Pantoea piersonii]MBZ6400182.1 methyl-accepting chemotaxis protein [Pantoea piersonii]MBZ6408306.1 methyl-accepting chemotaxis protein [Pantoea piersonii]MBZ6427902.1 methyl-accepting chemotaxis protein [Pantoea piersonii]NYB01955.1 Tar ligand binding domain-containing protein [Pantoea piersonii]
MNKLSLRTGLLALLAFMTLLLLAVSVMGIIAINKGNRSLDVINRIQGIELNALYQSNGDLMRARATAALAVRKIEIGLLDEGTASVKQAQADVQASQQSMKAFIAAGTVTEQGKKLADEVVATWNAYLAQGITPIMSALEKQYTDEYYSVLEGNLAKLALNYSNAVGAFGSYADQVTDAQLAQAARNEAFMKALIGAAVALTLLLFVLAWVLMRRLLLLPLNRAIAHLEQVAAGDLSQTLPPPGDNELGRLNRALGEMQQALRVQVSQVLDASQQIDVGSRELAAGNVHLSQRTEESAASLEQTAASMEQLTATVRLNAANAQQAHKLANSVSDTADRGAEVVCYVMEKMQEITDSANRIGDILGVIDGIAFQTNILALNASVEAARAGEQGRGFAVVANEVRTLAQRSANAAKEIRGLISESQTRVKEGSDMATRAGETMDEISSEVMRVTTLMKEISMASDEQSRGIEQVNQAVTQMDEVAQQNAALVEQATAATQSLEAQSQHLQSTVSLFRLETA